MFVGLPRLSSKVAYRNLGRSVEKTIEILVVVCIVSPIVEIMYIFSHTEKCEFLDNNFRKNWGRGTKK